MDIEKQFQEKLNNLKSRCANTTSYIGLLRQKIESSDPLSWKQVEYLLNVAQQKDKMHFLDLKNQIQRSVRDVKSFSMLCYFYYLKQTRRQFNFYSIYWKSEYQRVALQLGDINVFSSLIAHHSNSSLVQDTLWMIIKVFPKLIRFQNIRFDQNTLVSIIQWVSYFQTPDPQIDRYTDTCQIIKVAKQTRFTLQNNNYTLFYRLIEVICQIKNASSNLFLFFYPMPMMQNQITSFCQIHSDFLSNISQQALLNFFTAITKSSMTKQILLIILKISRLLLTQEQYFKLRYLYQNFVLPILAVRAKTCKKVEDLVLQICQLYILGFLKHCDISSIGIQCVIKNIGLIKNQKVLNRWLEICSVLYEVYPEYNNQMNRLLQAQLKRQIQLKRQNLSYIIQNSQLVWDVTLRNARKHKKYFKVFSKMLGITNRNNECYIISNVHGLQKNQLFQNLLDKYRQKIKGKSKLLDELRILFGEVSGLRKLQAGQKLNVGYLKKVSPEEFVKSEYQQDAYQYLIKLIDLIEQQMQNVPGMVQQFKQIFQINQINTIICSKCNEQSEKKSTNYVHTIHHTAVLSQICQQNLSDFICSKCKQKGYCNMRVKLIPTSKILIVHINRFSNNKGKIVKELSTQRIFRKFLCYELTGIICHKGKSVERGHYLYYHRINPKRWAVFNDNVVQQFQLQQPYQQFQSQWKAQMTPYILFYKQCID